LEQVPVPFYAAGVRADAGRMYEGTSLPNMAALATKIGNEESKSIQKLRYFSMRHSEVVLVIKDSGHRT
jgi:hypothetical protein